MARCRVRTEIQGLMREVNCTFQKIHFINANVGFAISDELGQGGGIAFGKTTDGGSTWSLSPILPGETGREGTIHFFDENTGVLRTQDGKMFRTTDAGATWNGASGQADSSIPDIGFADAEVGWMMRYHTMFYTTNGGQNWLSRQIAFPAQVQAFSLVQRDRGYAAGDHGMVYRYRVVPIEYMAKGMLAAPGMPAKR